MRNMHILSHWFFIKIKRFAPPTRAQNVADLGPNVPLRAALSAGRAGVPEALLPARDNLSVVDIVRNATLKRSDHRARGPGHALPELASLGVGGGVGRQQHAIAELAQGRIRGQRLLLEDIDGG